MTPSVASIPPRKLSYVEESGAGLLGEPSAATPAVLDAPLKEEILVYTVALRTYMGTYELEHVRVTLVSHATQFSDRCKARCFGHV